MLPVRFAPAEMAWAEMSRWLATVFNLPRNSQVGHCKGRISHPIASERTPAANESS